MNVTFLLVRMEEPVLIALVLTNVNVLLDGKVLIVLTVSLDQFKLILKTPVLYR